MKVRLAPFRHGRAQAALLRIVIEWGTEECWIDVSTARRLVKGLNRAIAKLDRIPIRREDQHT